MTVFLPRGGQRVAVRIRLQRKGARHMAFYRIVVADSRAPRDGRFVEQLGFYDPLKDPAVISVDAEKAIGWLGKGAQPSETVRSLFSRVGIMETWHEMKKGRPFDELRHIEEEARKKIEVRAAMERRKKDEKKGKKKAEAEKETVKAAVAAPESDASATEAPVEAAAVADVEADASNESGEAAIEPAKGEDVAEAPANDAAPEPEPVAEPAADEQGSAEGDETKTEG